ncbi:hypothetical protein [Rhizobium phaseoli]|uniref:hypothetical protein n=1 Tax=Rhizobium phaseoli TaxID=396 RepID=UPI000F747199|nr:hypothetical protein [Rhizobium phaseoli]
MLRIQSLAITSRSESTRTHTHHSAHHCAHNEVYSLDKRDRQSLFQRTSISAGPAKLRRPRFSFFQSSIVKEPTTKAVTKTRSKLAPRTQTSNPPIRLSFFRTRDFVASSAAALVSEWAYRTNPFSKSTAIPKVF